VLDEVRNAQRADPECRALIDYCGVCRGYAPATTRTYAWSCLPLCGIESCAPLMSILATEDATTLSAE